MSDNFLILYDSFFGDVKGKFDTLASYANPIYADLATVYGGVSSYDYAPLYVVINGAHKLIYSNPGETVNCEIMGADNAGYTINAVSYDFNLAENDLENGEDIIKAISLAARRYWKVTFSTSGSVVVSYDQLYLFRSKISLDHFPSAGTFSNHEFVSEARKPLSKYPLSIEALSKSNLATLEEFIFAPGASRYVVLYTPNVSNLFFGRKLIWGLISDPSIQDRGLGTYDLQFIFREAQ